VIRSEFMGKSCPKIPYTVLESLLIAWQEEAMLSQAFSFRYVAAANCLVVGAKPGASDSTGFPQGEAASGRTGMSKCLGCTPENVYRATRLELPHCAPQSPERDTC